MRECLYRLAKYNRGLAFQAKPRWVRLAGGRVALDAREFADAVEAGEEERAAALYSGEFLKGFHVPNAPEFAQWQDELRGELADKAQHVYRKCLETAELSGNWDRALTCATTLAGLDPYDEVAAIRLASLLLNRGAGGRARSELRAFTARLQAVGRMASSQVTRLLVAAEQPGSLVNTSSSRIPIVGREQEIKFLNDALVRADGGKTASVFVGGQAGYGKTAVCEQILRVAAVKGARVLTGICSDFSRDQAYAGVVSLLQGLTGREISEMAAGDQDLLRANFLANLPTEQRNMQEAMPPYALLEALTRIVGGLCARHLVVLFLDDLQWSDGRSTEFLRFLKRRLPEERLLVLAAGRREDLRAGDPVYTLTASADFEVLELQALDSRSVDRLADAFIQKTEATIPSHAVHAAQKASSGNPYFLLELLKTYEKEWYLQAGQVVGVPRSVEQFLNARISTLSADAFNVAAALSILGATPSETVLLHVANLEDDRLSAAVEELVRKGLVRETHSSVEFCHELAREAIARGLSPLRTRFLHARAAKALRAGRPLDVCALAAHSDLSDRHPDACRYAAIAARATERRFGYAEAEKYWIIALKHSNGAFVLREITERLAKCMFRQQKVDEARAYHVKLLAASGPSTPESIVYRSRMAALAAWRGSSTTDEECRTLLTAALALVGQRRAEALEAAISAILASNRQHVLTALHDDLARAAKEQTGGDSSYRVAYLLATHAAFEGRIDEADEFCELAASAAHATGSWMGEMLNGLRGTWSCFRGRPKDAEAHYRAAAAGRGREALSPSTRMNWSVLDIEMCRFEAARRDLHGAIDAADVLGLHPNAAIGWANLALADFECGDSDAALSNASAAVTLVGTRRIPAALILALSVRGLVEMSCGLKGAATTRSSLKRLVAGQDPFGGDFSYAYIFLARMAEREGRWAQAMKLVEKGIGLYAGRDFFCHGRLELEKARLLGGRDAEGALDLARAVRGRALEAEAVLMLNKSEALIRQLKRTAAGRGRHGTAAAEATDPGAFPGAGDRKVGSARANGSAGEQVVGGEARRPPTRLVAERSWSGRGTIVK